LLFFFGCFIFEGHAFTLDEVLRQLFHPFFNIFHDMDPEFVRGIYRKHELAIDVIVAVEHSCELGVWVLIN